ncbi:MAG: hypothetical protein JNK37_23280 [Verrucomicrobiales bacterium]|nr:hypothetical protein [Verrucomicrobiales bacterium]
MNDDELHDLIRQAHPKPEFSPSFQRDVWARVSVAEQTSWSALYRRWGESLFQTLAQPAPAMAVVMTTLLFGAGLGRIVSSENNAEFSRDAYVASINPVAAAHLANRE